MASELPDRPFLAYLTGLNDELIGNVYQSEICCLSIFRILPTISQQSIAMMVFNSNL